MGLNDLIVAIALRCCVSRFPWLSYVGSCERKRKQYELDFVIFIECMAREPYGYSIMLVRYIRPDAIILSKLAEGEELVAINVRAEEYRVRATARDLPGGAAPSSQA